MTDSPNYLSVLITVMLNSLLALLNSRDVMRDKLQRADPVPIRLHRVPGQPLSTAAGHMQPGSLYGDVAAADKDVRSIFLPQRSHRLV